MSNRISLTQMPNLVMNKIFESLDFSSILALRKVCHDLRNFIDVSKPASPFTRICVIVDLECICFHVGFKNSSKDTIKIYYIKDGEGCIIRWNKDGKYNETMVGNEDFVTVFCKDFDIILRHQKTILEHFNIYSNYMDPTNKKRLWESVNNSFKSLNHPLQVKSLYLEVKNHSEILNILRFIDQKSLEHTVIIGKKDNIGNLDEIGELEQEKQAKELKI